MSSSKVALLPKPLPSDEITLGEFLLHPLHPENDCFYSETTTPVEDVSDYFIHMRYKDLFALDQEGRFSHSYGAKFDLGKVWRQPNLLTVHAEQMIYRTLEAPRKAFSSACDDPTARKWIEDLVQQGHTTLYFVAGIKELKNARFKRAVLHDGGASSKLDETPIEKGARVPRHIRRDSSLGLGTEACLSGVFGVDLRKVQARICNQDEPHTLEDLDWNWVYHRIPDSNKQLMIGMGGAVKSDELRDMLDLSEDDVLVNLDTISNLSSDVISLATSPALRASSPALRARSRSPHPYLTRI